jgi:2-amino-4-hydroxy-6-hydroxymethyldihydropteridine diphosphokinase
MIVSVPSHVLAEVIMHTYLIALGSNLGDRKYHIDQAIAAIGSQCGKVLRIAPFQESAPIGAADQAFINGALTVESGLEPESMLEKLLKIETSLGRVRAERWGNRTIDLDIILCKSDIGMVVHQSRSLTIPHPEALSRDFVLAPSAAVAGDWIFPGTARTLGELWAKKSGSS